MSAYRHRPTSRGSVRLIVMLIVQRYINMSQEEKLAADGVTVGAGVALLISLSRAIAVVKAGSVRCLGGCLN